jgi:hypothetical protein
MLSPVYTAPGASSYIREPVELCAGTFLCWHADDLRTVIEERHMGGLCLVVAPGEVVVSRETPEKFCPMILTVPAAYPRVRTLKKGGVCSVKCLFN